jgi:glycosyltransferase involved in cell wall biosynthesis
LIKFIVQLLLGVVLVYYIALSVPFNLEAVNQEAQQGKRPRHVMWDVSQQLGAIVHSPEQYQVSALDKLCARIFGQPEHWALGRALVAQLDDNDLVFCTGEDVGIPLAILCKMAGKRPKLAVPVMAPDRLRTRTVLKLFSLEQQIALFLTNTQAKADSMSCYLNLAPDQVHLFPEQTDVKFFTPGAALADKSRPIIASAGLEQRDYKTLGIATQDLDVDVRICAVSPNASAKTCVTFPEVTPQNMLIRQHDWLELRQLYRDADVVVISLLNNHYSAGLTVLMEAMACRKPVVMTRTPGLAEKLIDQGYVIGVQPGDASSMQQAILKLLHNPEQAEALAERGYDLILSAHTSELYVDSLVLKLESLTKLPVLTPSLNVLSEEIPLHLVG